MSGGVESEATRQQQAAIAETRKRLAQEVDELTERFKPAIVKERLEARLAERARDIARFAREQPRVTAMVVVAWVALCVWSWRRKTA